MEAIPLPLDLVRALELYFHDLRKYGVQGLVRWLDFVHYLCLAPL